MQTRKGTRYHVVWLLLAGLLAAAPVLAADGEETAVKQVLKAQEKLKQLGYEPGPADGGLGARTMAALKKFQHDQHLKPTGVLDPVTLQALGIPAGTQQTGAKEVDAAAIIAQITEQQLLTILRTEGFAPTLKSPSVISMKLEGLNVLFLISENNKSVQVWAGFKSKKGTIDRVNEWNKTKRYSRAYLDKDGDPVIELDLDLTGGVSKERILDFIKTARISVSAFSRAITAD